MNRGAYIVRRVLLLIPTLLAIYTLTFLLIHATPGGPWSQGENRSSHRAQAAQCRLWSRQSALEQYIDYLWNVLHGDFGPSFASRSRTVTDIISETFPVSLQLGSSRWRIAVVAGITLGVIGAIHHNTLARLHHAASSRSPASRRRRTSSSHCWCCSSPASSISCRPAAGTASPSTKIIIPAVALALYPAAVLARYTRSSMLDVLSADYVRTAEPKGLDETLSSPATRCATACCR